MCIGKTAQCQGTMMGGIGHCGSCQCLDAMTPLKSSMKSKSARRLTQMLTFAVWLLTTSTKSNAWPLSFRGLPPLPPLPRAQQGAGRARLDLSHAHLD